MPHYANLEQYTEDEKRFWEAFSKCSGMRFTMYSGMTFVMTIRGNEMFSDRKRKSITRATIIQAYRKALELVAAGVVVDTPKKLCAFGASYLYPVFAHLGVFAYPDRLRELEAQQELDLKDK